MNNNPQDEIKKSLDAPEIPAQLSPDAVARLLEKRKQQEKQMRHFRFLKWGAGVAACGVVLSLGGYLVQRSGNFHDGTDSDSGTVTGGYCAVAGDYEQVYALMARYQAYAWNATQYRTQEDVLEVADSYDEGAAEDALASGESTDLVEFSETYNQESGVLESDLVQTDGRYIYFAASNTYALSVQIVAVDGGNMEAHSTLDLTAVLPDTVQGGNVEALYLENGRLIVIASVYDYTDENPAVCSDRTYVMTYEAGETPQLLGCYAQDGTMSDVRMMEDGTLYLVTSYAWFSQLEDDNYEDCIPAYYTGTARCMAQPAEILLPEESLDESFQVSQNFSSAFTNIGSLRLFSDTPDVPLDFKALAGFQGALYSTTDTIYLASAYWEEDQVRTDLTRLSLSDGILTPDGSATVDGTVKDSFSMSAYDGYFRVAVTREYTYDTQTGVSTTTASSRDNALYIFDDQMQQVGALEGLAESETIQSVRFQGDLAYVVTYRQTDPLFAIDLSDPAHPVVLDAYEITGYSTYLQPWDTTHLLGFGVDADEEGERLGLKLVMFDSSDPENLTACDTITMHLGDLASTVVQGGRYVSISSIAEYERKALLIAPEKNLIAVPFDCYQYDDTADHLQFDAGYGLYTYTEGHFTCSGVFYGTQGVSMERAIFIEQTVYLLSSKEILAVDLDTMQETDRMAF